MLIIAVLNTDYYEEAEDTDSQLHPVQTDPANGDPDTAQLFIRSRMSRCVFTH